MPLQRMEFAPAPSPWQDVLGNALKQYQNSKYEMPLKMAQTYAKNMYGANLYPSMVERIMHDPVALGQLEPGVRDIMATQMQNWIKSQGRMMPGKYSQTVSQAIPQYGQGAQPVAPGQLGQTPDQQPGNETATQADQAYYADTPERRQENQEQARARANVHQMVQAGEFSDNQQQSSFPTLSPRQKALEQVLAARNKLPDYEGAVEEAKKGAGTEITRSTKADDEAHAAALNNQQFSKNLEDFMDSYRQSSIKGGWLDLADTLGPVGKAAIKFGSPKTAEALTKAVQLQVGAANQFFGQATGGKVTNMKLNLARDIKLDPHMEPETAENNYKSAKSYSDRIAQWENFRYNAKQNGFGETEKNAAFGAYMNEAPPYDPKTHKPIQYHQGTEEYYTSPEFLERLRSHKVLNTNEPPRFLHEGKVYVYKNGKYYMEV